MFRYLLAAVAAIYCVLLVYGDESRRPEVTRQSSDDVTGVTLAGFADTVAAPVVTLPESGMSDADAVRLAMRAGTERRAQRNGQNLRGTAGATIEPVATPTTTSAPDLWYVAGTLVNLRAGPGTSNAVVGRVASGDAAEVVDNQDGWYHIRTADGALSGWIFGKFLSETKPG